MLSDPLSIQPVTAVTQGTALVFPRLDTGIYRLSTSTMDEPTMLTVQNTLVPHGTSSFVVKASLNKNAPGTAPYGAKPLPDDVSSAHFVIRQCHRAHSASDIAYLRNLIAGFLYTSAIYDGFLGGQR